MSSARINRNVRNVEMPAFAAVTAVVSRLVERDQLFDYVHHHAKDWRCLSVIRKSVFLCMRIFIPRLVHSPFFLLVACSRCAPCMDGGQFPASKPACTWWGHEGKREEISAICGFGLHWMLSLSVPLLLCSGTGRNMKCATELHGVPHPSVGWTFKNPRRAQCRWRQW
jgi:hypothetical protein